MLYTLVSKIEKYFLGTYNAIKPTTFATESKLSSNKTTVCNWPTLLS